MRKILYFLVFVLLLSVAVAQEGNVTQEDEFETGLTSTDDVEGFISENFAAAETFFSDPEKARAHPSAYKVYLDMKPEAAGENPDSYEGVVEDDCDIINENPDAFENYIGAETGSDLDMQGEIDFYEDGLYTTSGTGTTFSNDVLAQMDNPEIRSDGSIQFGDKGQYIVSGDLSTDEPGSVTVSGHVSNPDGRFDIITKDESRATIHEGGPISVSGNNHMISVDCADVVFSSSSKDIELDIYVDDAPANPVGTYVSSSGGIFSVGSEPGSYLTFNAHDDFLGLDITEDQRFEVNVANGDSVDIVLPPVDENGRQPVPTLIHNPDGGKASQTNIETGSLWFSMRNGIMTQGSDNLYKNKFSVPIEIDSPSLGVLDQDIIRENERWIDFYTSRGDQAKADEMQRRLDYYLTGPNDYNVLVDANNNYAVYESDTQIADIIWSDFHQGVNAEGHIVNQNGIPISKYFEDPLTKDELVDYWGDRGIEIDYSIKERPEIVKMLDVWLRTNTRPALGGIKVFDSMVKGGFDMGSHYSRSTGFINLKEEDILSSMRGKYDYPVLDREFSIQGAFSVLNHEYGHGYMDWWQSKESNYPQDYSIPLRFADEMITKSRGQFSHDPNYQAFAEDFASQAYAALSSMDQSDRNDIEQLLQTHLGDPSPSERQIRNLAIKDPFAAEIIYRALDRSSYKYDPANEQAWSSVKDSFDRLDLFVEGNGMPSLYSFRNYGNQKIYGQEGYGSKYQVGTYEETFTTWYEEPVDIRRDKTLGDYDIDWSRLGITDPNVIQRYQYGMMARYRAIADVMLRIGFIDQAEYKYITGQ
ncbi:hypothetical protein JW968_05050 [Candidatus Woesearchaeota archaeon]|nr:hypothetical protein [Candidatus Woesearchaeota archaeon]